MTARGERKRSGDGRVDILDVDPIDQSAWAAVPSAAPPPLAPAAPAASRRRTWIALGAVGAFVAIVVAANVVGGPEERPKAVPASTTVDGVDDHHGGDHQLAAARRLGPGYGAASSVPVVLAAAATWLSAGRRRTLRRWSRRLDRSAVDDVVDHPDRGDVGVDHRRGPWTSGSCRWAALGVWLRTGVGILTKHDDGTSTLDANVGDRHVIMTADGLSNGQLAAAMDSIRVDGEQLSDPASFSGLGLRKVADVEQLPTDAPSVRASYIAFAGPRADQWISVTVGQSLSTYSRTMRSFLLRDPVAMTVGGGHLATFGTDGRVADGEPHPIGIVDVDGIEVELSGGTSVDQLVTMAQTLRLGTEDDWTAIGRRNPTRRSGGRVERAVGDRRWPAARRQHVERRRMPSTRPAS